MRNLFGVLAILLAVVALGVFRVPDENALVAAGIRAEADGLLYQQRHPLSVSVKGRVLSVEGRVESEADRLDVRSRLEALDGVERVVDNLTVLPEVTPFVLEALKGPEGVSLSGYVSRDALARDLGEVLGIEVALPVATGAPDADWGGVARRAAAALARMETGRFVLRDRALRVEGRVHLPITLAALRAELADLPDGYEADLRIEAIDDGRPYALLIARDPLLGLRVSGKLPPDFDLSRLEALGQAQDVAVSLAPLPLDHADFVKALDAVLPLAAALPLGSIGVAPGVVVISGGPVPEPLIGRAEALVLPEGWAKHVSLVPQDTGAPLALSAEWDGARLSLTGRVPEDFNVTDLLDTLGAKAGLLTLDAGPYPDLTGWGNAVRPMLQGLILLDRGTISYGAEAARIEGLAADAGVRRAAGAVSGLATDAVQLADDGAPPVFTLVYDATSGARVSGKLPAGLGPRALGEALGIEAVRGAPKVAPEGDGDAALAALRAVAPWIAELETLDLSFDRGTVALRLGTVRGADRDALRAVLAPRVAGKLGIVQAPPASSGARRVHAALGLPQIFSDGWWFPALAIVPTAEGCAEAVATVPDIPFASGRFVPEPGSALPLAHLAAVARTCTDIAGLTLVIEAEAASAGIDVLNRQLSRRRAEALREALILRGVAASRVGSEGLGQGPADRIGYRWQ